MGRVGASLAGAPCPFAANRLDISSGAFLDIEQLLHFFARSRPIRLFAITRSLTTPDFYCAFPAWLVLQQRRACESSLGIAFPLLNDSAVCRTCACIRPSPAPGPLSPSPPRGFSGRSRGPRRSSTARGSQTGQVVPYGVGAGVIGPQRLLADRQRPGEVALGLHDRAQVR